MTGEPQTETKTACRIECPSCGKKGKRVSTVTLANLLKPEFAKRFTTDSRSQCDSNGGGCKPAAGDTGWRFCDSPDCEVVYYAEENDTIFTKPQLKVPVGVKERSGERPLCYCFGHSVASIKQELRAKGRSDALEDIRAKMKNPGCRCKWVNPSGSCCLGSVARGIKIAQEELEDELKTRGARVGNGAGPVKDGGSSLASNEGRPAEKGALLATLGAACTAILGSACCWLPLLLIAFGFSAAGVGSFFEQYRPYFLTATFVLLGVAWYFTYRHAFRNAWARLRGGPTARPAVEACCASEETPAAAGSCCATEPKPVADDCCAPGAKTVAGKPARRGFTIRQFNQVMLWMATVAVLLFALFPHWVGLILGSGGNSNAAFDLQEQQRVVLEVRGMTCEGCAVHVQEALRKVPGVVAANVSYEKKQAVVWIAKGREVPREALLQAVRQAGYEARLRF